MDVITLSSYTNIEKKHIFHKHLLPKAITDGGLDTLDSFELEDNLVDTIVNDYCREPGVRSLERHSKKIIDRIAFEIVKSSFRLS